jgi:nucleoside-diphosphate-sugar epimerase
MVAAMRGRTGACGHFARSLLPQLIRHGGFGQIVGVDVMEPAEPLDGIEYHQLDVRSRRMLALLEGADVLIHLAFVIFHRGRRRRTEEINIDGSIQTFEMAARRHVKRIVVASSHAVYGAHPDNPVPLDENWPRRGNESLHYSWAKRLIEEYLDTFEARYPEVELVRLRPCTVWGPHVPPNRAQLYLSSIALAAARYDAPIQLLHEADVARAFVAAASLPNVRGAFNLAPNDWVRPSDLRRLLDVHALDLPGTAVRLINRLMWHLFLTEISPEWLVLARHPIILNNRRAARQLGWRPTRTTVDVAKETLAVIRGESPLFRQSA